MKAILEISQSHLQQLLRSINRINSIPDEDVHADIHLKIDNNSIQIYSQVEPVYILHKIEDGNDISVDIESGGQISFNIETLVNIVQKAGDGEFQIEFRDEEYRISTPSGSSFTPVKFRLPRHAESLFQSPFDVRGLYLIDSVPRDELRRGLSTMEVLDEFVNISVSEDTLTVSIQNQVTGHAEVEKNLSNPDLSAMSQFYLLRPMREFVSTINDVDTVDILVSEMENICLRAVIDGWTAELHLASKADSYTDTYVEYS